MRTPYGAECSYYYQDFHRGRDVQECRLLAGTSGDALWKPTDCKDCPVPGIQRANACEYLVLAGELKTGMLGFGRRMQVTAHCIKTKRDVPEPHIGCGECHTDIPGIDAFLRGLED